MGKMQASEVLAVYRDGRDQAIQAVLEWLKNEREHHFVNMRNYKAGEPDDLWISADDAIEHVQEMLKKG